MSTVLLWKKEPGSPLDFDEASLDDATLYQTSLDQYDIKFDADLAACESKAEVASHILENLENLMDLDDLIKDEPFLLDEKILPIILDEVEPPRAIPVPVQNQKSEYPSSTQYLLQEFQTMYDVVELAHTKPPQGTLTPPQSPPSQPPLLTTLEPLLNFSAGSGDKSVVFSVPEKQFLENYTAGNDIVELNFQLNFQPVSTPQPDIAHELAVVEELVRSRVENMQWSTTSSSSSGPGSPGGSSSSSCSNFGDCSSDDPEWVPEPVDGVGEPAKPSRKRTRPYSKGPPEEKRVRKKEQNKNAATRYRMKKKAQVEEILSEEKTLLDHKAELGGKITDLEREVKYLKGLMRDLFKAKGLIN